MNKDSTVKVVYVYDALCGWCFGFGPVIQQLEQKYKGTFQIDVISGGMVPKAQAQPIGFMSGYILNTIPRLERTTGVRFGQPYIQLLQEGKMVLYSDPAALALTILKTMAPGKDVAFSHAIQHAMFVEGKDITKEELYIPMAASFGLDTVEFKRRWQDPSYTTAYLKEYAWVKQMRVNGFPQLFLQQGDRWTKLSEGYTTAAAIESTLTKLGVHAK